MNVRLELRTTYVALAFMSLGLSFVKFFYVLCSAVFSQVGRLSANNGKRSRPWNLSWLHGLCTHEQRHMHAHTQTYTHTHTYAHTHTYRHTRTCMHTLTHTRRRTFTHTHTHTHIHAYTHKTARYMHTCLH